MKAIANPIMIVGDNSHGIIRAMAKPQDLIGKVFSRLTVLKRAGHYLTMRRWECRCVCGNKTFTTTGHLVSGHTKSCGCLIAETTRKRVLTHGRSGSPEWHAWTSMKKRCYNPGKLDAPRYAGIEVASEWRDDFRAFFDYVGPRPSIDHSLDRWPNKYGNYEPGNVRWATRREQAQNTSKTKYWTLDGVTKARAQWARELGFPHSTQIIRRLATGWSLRDALTLPSGSVNPERSI